MLFVVMYVEIYRIVTLGTDVDGASDSLMSRNDRARNITAQQQQQRPTRHLVKSIIHLTLIMV